MNHENESIIKKLDIIIRLLAVNAVKDKKFIEQVKLLSDFGFEPKDIAKMTGKTANNVRVQLHVIRKNEKIEENDKKGEK